MYIILCTLDRSSLDFNAICFNMSRFMGQSGTANNKRLANCTNHELSVMYFPGSDVKLCVSMVMLSPVRCDTI